MYQMIYPSEPNSERFNLFLCHVFFRYISVAPYLPRLGGSDSQNEWFSTFFLSVGARAQVCFVSPNFDVIRTKEAEMEPW